MSADHGKQLSTRMRYEINGLFSMNDLKPCAPTV